MNIKQVLLLEAADVSTGEKILKALEKGMIPGVKKKFIAPKDAGQDELQRVFDKISDLVKQATDAQSYNKYLFLVLKKANNFETLKNIINSGQFGEWMDSIHAYFNNLNKQEVRSQEDVKKRFEEFASRKYDLEKDKQFENWANEKFAEKAKVKDREKEIDKIYDKGGWEIVIPKTFAAAREYACMNNRKAAWCTAARPSFYKMYTGDGKGNLYIIRSEKNDKMYQMNWGEGSFPNFKNEQDNSAKVSDVFNDVPKEVLKFLKHPKTKKSIWDMYQERKKKEKEIIKKHEKTPIKGAEGWTERKLTPIEAKNTLQGVRFSFGSRKIEDLSIEELLSGSEVGGKYHIKSIKEITNGKKYFYQIEGNVGRSDLLRLVNPIFEKVGERLVAKKSKGLLSSKLPDVIKKEVFKPTDMEIGKKGEASDIKPTKEIGDAKFYDIKSINQIFDLAGKKQSLAEHIKKEISNAKNSNNFYRYFKMGDIHYFYELIDNGEKMGISRFVQRSDGSYFQGESFKSFARRNKDVIRYLISVSDSAGKLKKEYKKVYEDVIDIIEKGKKTYEIDGVKFVINEKGHGQRPHFNTLESPEFPEDKYRMKFEGVRDGAVIKDIAIKVDKFIGDDINSLQSWKRGNWKEHKIFKGPEVDHSYKVFMTLG